MSFVEAISQGQPLGMSCIQSRTWDVWDVWDVPRLSSEPRRQPYSSETRFATDMAWQRSTTFKAWIRHKNTQDKLDKFIYYFVNGYLRYLRLLVIFDKTQNNWFEPTGYETTSW
jgi:hypothetical protein